MNNKMTISHINECHLYKDCFDDENIYIEMKDVSGCCFEIWQHDTDIKSTVRIRVPVKAWKRMIRDWKEKNKDKVKT